MNPRDELRSRFSEGRGSEETDSRRARSEEIAEKYRRRAAERSGARASSAAERPSGTAGSGRTQRTEISIPPIRRTRDDSTAAPVRRPGEETTGAPIRRQRAESAAAPARRQHTETAAAPVRRQHTESSSSAAPRPRKKAAAPVRPAGGRGGGGRTAPNRSLLLGLVALAVLVLAVVTISKALHREKPATASNNSGNVAGAEATAGVDGGSDAALAESVTETETPMETTTEAAAAYNGEKFADTGIPAVALTYDDGPKSSTTPIILDVLEQYNAHATFFIVGKNVEGNEDLIKREEALGCELGNHSWDHSQLTSLSDSGWKEQLSKTKAAIEAAADHAQVTVMRPPYGAINQEMRDQIDIPVILWRLDTLDWKTKSASATIDAVLDDVRGGDVILMHDIHDFSAEATKTIVPQLIEKGYKLLTVSELYDYYGEELTLHHNHGFAEAQSTEASEEGSSSASSSAAESTAASTGESGAGSASGAAESSPAAGEGAAAEANQ